MAGTIKSTLIVTLPGSVKAVKENLDALLAGGVIEHAIELIKGGTGQQLHSVLGSSADDVSLPVHGQGHHNRHHHHHHSHRSEHVAPQPRSVLSHDPTASGKCEMHL